MRFQTFLLFSFSTFLGCHADSASQATVDSGFKTYSEETADVYGILRFVHSSMATVEVLDLNVGLDSRAAENLVSELQGVDGVRGTEDDVIITTISELDAIPYIGEAGLRALYDYCDLAGWFDDYTYVSGVPFVGDELPLLEDLLYVANVYQLADIFGEELPIDPMYAPELYDSTRVVNSRPSLVAFEEIVTSGFVSQNSLMGLQKWTLGKQFSGMSTTEATTLLAWYTADIEFHSEGDEPVEVIDLGPYSDMPNGADFIDILEQAEIKHSTGESWILLEADVTSAASFEHVGWSDIELTRWRGASAVLRYGLQDSVEVHVGERSSSGEIEGHVEVFVVGFTTDGDLVGIRTQAGWT